MVRNVFPKIFPKRFLAILKSQLIHTCTCYFVLTFKKKILIFQSCPKMLIYTRGIGKVLFFFSLIILSIENTTARKWLSLVFLIMWYFQIRTVSLFWWSDSFECPMYMIHNTLLSYFCLQIKPAVLKVHTTFLLRLWFSRW